MRAVDVQEHRQSGGGHRARVADEQRQRGGDEEGNVEEEGAHGYVLVCAAPVRFGAALPVFCFGQLLVRVTSARV